jgi:4-amino-4-deoxy-L-arabinose transferase-like glycosyltransferase
LIADLLSRLASSSDSFQRKYWRLTFYVALALAFLAKGPLGWMPLLTVAIMKFFLRGQPLNRRFWFATGMLLTMAIVLSWGIPALVRTKGEFFWVGIGRHVVERSFGAMEGHGGQTWSSYFITLPFYFVTVFFSFFPWSIKLPALTKRLWRDRDGIDKYLIVGTAIIFILMTVVKTKLPHYTLTAFPLLSLLLARHLFALPGSPRFAVRAAVGAAVVMLGMALIGFPMLARTFPTVQLFEKSEKDLSPEMHFASVDYAEPSLVWYFRSHVHGFYWALKPEHVEKFMAFSGPRFVIMPTDVARTVYPELPAGWKSYTAQGFNFAKGQRADLTMILKPTQ